MSWPSGTAAASTAHVAGPKPWCRRGPSMPCAVEHGVDRRGRRHGRLGAEALVVDLDQHAERAQRAAGQRLRVGGRREARLDADPAFGEQRGERLPARLGQVQRDEVGPLGPARDERMPALDVAAGDPEPGRERDLHARHGCPHGPQGGGDVGGVEALGAVGAPRVDVQRAGARVDAGTGVGGELRGRQRERRVLVRPSGSVEARLEEHVQGSSPPAASCTIEASTSHSTGA